MVAPVLEQGRKPSIPTAHFQNALPLPAFFQGSCQPIGAARSNAPFMRVPKTSSLRQLANLVVGEDPLFQCTHLVVTCFKRRWSAQDEDPVLFSSFLKKGPWNHWCHPRFRKVMTK